MNYYISALKKYAVFSGRSNRPEFWYFLLFNFIISFALGFIEGFLGIASYSDSSILGVLYNLAVFIPSLAVGVRRMHDVGKSGWLILVPIYNIILCATKGDDDSNKYGPPLNTEIELDNPNGRFCTNCGSPINLEAKFCISCGKKVN